VRRHRICAPTGVRSASGSGGYVEDLEGQRYFAHHAGYGAILLGHCYPAINEAVVLFVPFFVPCSHRHRLATVALFPCSPLADSGDRRIMGQTVSITGGLAIRGMSGPNQHTVQGATSKAGSVNGRDRSHYLGVPTTGS
jgi:hypothetical protein